MITASFFKNRLNIVSLIIGVLLLFLFLSLYAIPTDEKPQADKQPKNKYTSNEKAEIKKDEPVKSKTNANENFDDLTMLIKEREANNQKHVTIKGKARLITINHKNKFYGFRLYSNNQKIFVRTYNHHQLPNNDDTVIVSGVFSTPRSVTKNWTEHPYLIKAIEIKKNN